MSKAQRKFQRTRDPEFVIFRWGNRVFRSSGRAGEDVVSVGSTALESSFNTSSLGCRAATFFTGGLGAILGKSLVNLTPRAGGSRMVTALAWIFVAPCMLISLVTCSCAVCGLGL